MMIDMHTHWRPADIADALRARAREPRILRNDDGVEVLRSRMGEECLSSWMGYQRPSDCNAGS